MSSELERRMEYDYENLPNFLKNFNSVIEDDIEGVAWLHGNPPDYSLVNQLYVSERTKIPKPGSLEDLITNLIKNWEKEISHKTNPLDWKTVDTSCFRASINGAEFLTLPEIGKVGAYNAFIGETEFYAASFIPDPTESHRVFRTALKNGFALEILEVFTPPPKVIFKWRHWGNFEGEMKCPMRSGKELVIPPNGNRLQLFGTATILLNDKFQIQEMEFYFRPDTLMEQMLGLQNKQASANQPTGCN